MHAKKGKDPTNNGKPYHDWTSNDDEMRREERLIAGRLPFNPMNAREVDEMRHDWSRNGYLRQNKSIIFEISVIAMQQVIAEYQGLPEFKGKEYAMTGTELDVIKNRMNKRSANTGTHWKANVLEQTQQKNQNIQKSKKQNKSKQKTKKKEINK